MKRPVSPIDLRTALLGQKDHGGSINPPSIWSVCQWFKNVGVDDRERHDLLDWLTDDPSSKHLSMGQVKVLAEWLTSKESQGWLVFELAMLREEIDREGGDRHE